MLRLASGGALASVAGCLTGTPFCRQEFGLTLQRVTDADVVEQTDRTPAALHPLTRDVVRGAGPAGRTTYRSARSEPTLTQDYHTTRYEPTNSFVRVGDALHRVAVDTVVEETTTGHVLLAATGPRIDADAQSGDAVHVAELPTHDRRTTLAKLGRYAGRGQDEVDDFEELWTVGYLRDESEQSSLLVPDPDHEYLRHRGWFVRLEKLRTDAVTLRTYEVVLEPAGDSMSDVARTITATDGVDLDGTDLTAEQRGALDRADGTTYRECGDPSDDWVELRRTVADARYVRYDDTWFRVEWLT